MVQMSLRSSAVSSEPSLLAHTKCDIEERSGSVGRVVDLGLKSR